MMADERRLDVLRAIVEDYVATHEPVGSKALLDRHQLGVSPATIRNDMSVLEDEGYIVAPHTSAGRIPTDKGYRMFVDRLADIKPMSGAERRAIEGFISGAADIDEVLQRSVKVLAQLTNQVAVVQYPSLTRATVRHIELVALEESRILAVVITSTGRVEQRIVQVADPLTDELLADLRSRIVRATVGERLADASRQLAELIETFAVDDRPVVGVLVSALAEVFSDERSGERLVVGGTANVARFGADFDTNIRPVLEALEEQVVLLRLFGELASDRGVPHVLIGTETGHEGLIATSLVSSTYGNDAETFATLGTVGPTRMDYPATITAVGAVARYVGRLLADG
jgi:heat-inducible transcriptional repressor